MPSSADHCPACRRSPFTSKTLGSSRGFWPSIVRIVFLEVAMLLALAGGVVFYLNWSSETAFTEFLAAGKMQATSGSPLNAVKGHSLCERDA